MTRIGLVACSKLKLGHAAPAGALYSSPLFRKSLLAALQGNDLILILSALHGVLPLTKVIAPYDITLKRLSAAERISWATQVSEQLSAYVQPGDTVSFYCGQEYTRPLRTWLSSVGCKVIEPLGRLSLGPRLARLALLNRESDLHSQMKSTTTLLKRLSRAQKGGRRFDIAAGRSDWPQRGLYIILDEGRGGLAVSRIGTHAVSTGSKTTLWNRLSTHRGTLSGSGSHRSSIFRSHVGRAIIAASGGGEWPETWGHGQNASKDVRANEQALEQAVSAYIGRLKVLWLNVPDEPGPGSDRSYLERNLIGLYSRFGILTPSAHSGWLGQHSPDWRIASSSLWNLDHLFLEPDRTMFEVLNAYVDVTVGDRLEPRNPLAPEGWWERATQKKKSQLTLFDEGSA
jgi:hypothetical protein